MLNNDYLFHFILVKLCNSLYITNHMIYISLFDKQESLRINRIKSGILESSRDSNHVRENPLSDPLIETNSIYVGPDGKILCNYNVC